MAKAIKGEGRNRPAIWHYDFLEQIGVNTEDLARLTSDIKKSSGKYEVVAHNKNAHGGYRVSFLGESHLLAPQLRDHVVIKSGSKRIDLEGELMAITLMNATMPNGVAGIDVVSPLYPHAVKSDDGEFHILLHRVHGESIESRIAGMNSKESLPLLRRIAEFTAAAHAKMHVKEKAINAFAEFGTYSTRLKQLAKASKIVDLNILDAELARLSRPMKAIYEKFATVDRYYRKDPTMTNWIVDKTIYSGEDVDKMSVVAIDWEFTRTPCPREFELSKLLHQGDHLNRNSPLNGRASDELITTYIDSFREYGGIPIQSKEAFKARVLLGDAPKCFNFLAYAFDKPHLHLQVRQYIANTMHSIEVLQCARVFNGSMAKHYGQIIESFRYLDSIVPRNAK